MIAAQDASPIAGLVMLAILVGGYFLPTIIAVARKTRNATQVAIVNLFLGWSFIGWVVALAMAASPNKRGS